MDEKFLKTVQKEAKKILTIAETSNVSALFEQMKNLPSLYAVYSTQLSEVQVKIAEIKLELRVKEAEIAKEVRAKEEKISEAKIDRILFERKEYIDICKKLNETKRIEGYLLAVVKGLEQKHSILITILAAMKHENKML